MRNLLRTLWRDRSGVSALEFALVAPVLALFTIGTVEFGRLILVTQKLQNGAFILSDLASRDRTLSEDQLANIFLATNTLMQPFAFETNGAAIVTSVVAGPSNNAVIAWQRRNGAGVSAQSRVGLEGSAPNLPAAIDLKEGDTLIVTEMFYDYEPVFGLTAGAQTIHKIAYYKPRLGTLETLLP